MARKNTSNVYSQIIVEIFQRHYQAGLQEFSFDRSEVGSVAVQLGVQLPSNIGDVFYTALYLLTA